VQILDNNAIPVETGTVGRIFVGNGAQFTGYTGGGGKETVDDLMASGDVGYFDENGLLFVTGRSDDMIVSGGENVFPGEVEDLLTSHPEVAEAAVIGVDDPDFGQRLEAFVVLRPGVVADSDDGELFKNFVATKLARHKVPRQVSIIDELPRNATGKLLRDQLR
jgi:fatty-acyl-CoA synthase